ncbi:C4b-binding protein alpha chain-like [Hippocampus zosterae]|uniref:C4b-binding protein alpha chain-like n=1 Tax=Hippocampus zosterae TaxID=109293 RepID=UPI00223C91F5|nr:C4b-binding protein alpha chain-like [Hippocampus zosterae]
MTCFPHFYLNTFNMRFIVWNILCLFISLLDTAEFPKRCSAPPQFPSTRLQNKWRTRSTFDIGEKVYYKCADDFVAYAGSLSAMCVNGIWTALTLKCKQRSCGNVGDLPNGRFRYEGRPLIGKRVYALCNDGYTLKGAKYMTCERAGWTGEFPTCESGCSAPKNLDESHANLADEFIMRTTFAAGEQVTYTCDVGYSPVGGSRYRKCISGQWTPLLVKCEQKLCGSAGEIQNGRFIYTGVEFGDIATAHCDDGFQLVQPGNLLDFAPFHGAHCIFLSVAVVECEEPPEVSNAEQNGKEEAPYKYRSVVVYECRTGNLVGNKAIWCTENGTWSAPPLCREITCPSPKVPNASWTRAHTRLYQHRDTISIDCHHGYTVVGTSTVTCGDDGQWIPSLPKCRRTCKSTPLVEIYQVIVIVLTFINKFISCFCVCFLARHTKWQSRYAV